MTLTADKKTASFPLIHVATIQNKHGGRDLLFLRKKEPQLFAWMEENPNGQEHETPVSSSHIEEAIRMASRHWKNLGFRPLNCGFRYTLPERDEHGINALFYQMAASYSTSNGVYFDEDLSSNCFVQAASDEAKDLWKKLKLQGRL